MAEHIAAACGGDVRKAVNAVELLLQAAPRQGDVLTVTLEDARMAAQRSAMRYDRAGDDHYDILSALQKSIRGSDPDAACHYLARLLEAGDLISACRRLMVIACEDVGLAYPQIIPIVKACVDAANMLGLPEARIPLGDAAVLMATAPQVQLRPPGPGRRTGGRAPGEDGGLPPPPPEQARPTRRGWSGSRATSTPTISPTTGGAAVPARRPGGHPVLHLRREQGRAGRPALLGGDQGEVATRRIPSGPPPSRSRGARRPTCPASRR